tara:strand:- start:28 stop:1761 length:1734 start_codon:yes stop_codon:yes gene_type:complete
MAKLQTLQDVPTKVDAKSIVNNNGVLGIPNSFVRKISPNSFKDFGAKGDGTNDDTTAVLSALNNSTGKVLDGGGLTYKCNSMITPTSDYITVQNATFDFSGVTATGNTTNAFIMFEGSAASATALSSDASVGDSVLTVASTTGFSADSWHILESDTTFASAESVTLGQYVFIKSVDSSTQVTLHNDVLYEFKTSANAQLVPITMKKNITFRNVNIIGANPSGVTTANTHTGLRFKRCEATTVENCKFNDIDYLACAIDRSVNSNISNCNVKHATATGLSYGFGILNGSYSVNVVNSYGQDLRHFVTLGDNEGVNLFVSVTNCHISACRDAGIDAHSASDFINFSGNTIEGSTFDSGNHDGIIFQGLNCVISDNTIVGIRRHAVHHQVLPNIPEDEGGSATTIITGNKIINHGGSSGTDVGLLVSNASNVLGKVEGVTICNNVVEGSANVGIYIQAVGGAIKNISISDNVINDADSRACWLRSYDGYAVSNATVTGNVLNFTASGSEGIELLGTSSTKTSNAAVNSNVITGTNTSDTGIKLSNTDYVVVVGNVIKDTATPIDPASAATNHSYSTNLSN